jgi:hypothetical protein
MDSGISKMDFIQAFTPVSLLKDEFKWSESEVKRYDQMWNERRIYK